MKKLLAICAACALMLAAVCAKSFTSTLGDRTVSAAMAGIGTSKVVK